MCRMANIIHVRKVSFASVLRFLDGLIRTDAKRSKVGPAVTMIDSLWCTSVLLDPRAFLSTNMFLFSLFFLFFCHFSMPINYLVAVCVDVYEDTRRTYMYMTSRLFGSRLLRGRKKKKRSYKQVLRARQFLNKPDSQDRCAHAKCDWDCALARFDATCEKRDSYSFPLLLDHRELFNDEMLYLGNIQRR